MRLVRRGSLGVRADLDLAPAQCAGDSKLIEQYEAHQGRVMLPEVASCFPRSLHVWSTMKDVRIAILGGGILGTCTALELARRGRRSTLFEGQSSLLQGASRWNEGKIHLGFLYAGDPTLRTAQRLIPGGLAFAGLVERLIQRSLDEFVTEEDDIYLVHRQSIVAPEAFEAYSTSTAALVREAASQPNAQRYLCDVTHAGIRRLSASDLAQVTSADEVIAGYRIPERSVSTVAVADLMLQTVVNERLIEIRADRRVRAVERRSDGRFNVFLNTTVIAPEDAPFDVVINALWDGRPAVDGFSRHSARCSMVA
jgi:glycine/D-amino acid oxidase-like deaminating enzyme